MGKYTKIYVMFRKKREILNAFSLIFFKIYNLECVFKK